MPTPNNDQPIAAEAAAVADVPVLPVAVDAATIVAAAINNSANSNISALPDADAPSGAAINQTSSGTPRPHANASSDRESEAFQQELGGDANEARKAESERKRKEKQKEKEMHQLGMQQ